MLYIFSDVQCLVAGPTIVCVCRLSNGLGSCLNIIVTNQVGYLLVVFKDFGQMMQQPKVLQNFYMHGKGLASVFRWFSGPRMGGGRSDDDDDDDDDDDQEEL